MTATAARGTAPQIPPHDIEAEEWLLGSMMLSRDAIRAAAHVSEADLYRPWHRTILRGIRELDDEALQADPMTLSLRLPDRELEANGGKVALLAMHARTPPSANAKAYADTVIRKARHRRAITLAGELQEAGYLERDPSPALLTELAAFSAPRAGGRLQAADLAAALAGDLPEPGLLERTDGKGLFYRNAVNYLIGEPEGGKSLVAQCAAVATLEMGGRVVILDFEDAAAPTARRLLALGAFRSRIVEDVVYAADPRARDTASAAIAEAVTADLVIIDGVAAALSAAGLDENDAGDVSTWWDTLPGPVAATGATVICIDHQTKARDSRGLWPRGSGAKQARIDGAAYIVEKADAFNRTTAGRIRLKVAKDRHGMLAAPTGAVMASIYVEPHDGGARIRTVIGPPLPDVEDEPQPGRNQPGPEAVDAVLAVLAAADAPLTRNELYTGLRAKPHRLSVRDAELKVLIKELADEGRIVQTPGPNRSRLHALPPAPPTAIEDPLPLEKDPTP